MALACGMVPIADGTDLGGSLRNPAAFCNVVGLRSSPGRVASETNSWSPLGVSGPMARSVGDVALFLSAMAGFDPRSPLSIPEDPARFRAPRHVPVLCGEIVAALAIVRGDCHADAPVGAGGSPRALRAGGANVVACGRDRGAIAAGQGLVGGAGGRVRLGQGG